MMRIKEQRIQSTFLNKVLCIFMVQIFWVLGATVDKAAAGSRSANASNVNLDSMFQHLQDEYNVQQEQLAGDIKRLRNEVRKTDMHGSRKDEVREAVSECERMLVNKFEQVKVAVAYLSNQVGTGKLVGHLRDRSSLARKDTRGSALNSGKKLQPQRSRVVNKEKEEIEFAQAEFEIQTGVGIESDIRNNNANALAAFLACFSTLPLDSRTPLVNVIDNAFDGDFSFLEDDIITTRRLIKPEQLDSIWNYLDALAKRYNQRGLAGDKKRELAEITMRFIGHDKSIPDAVDIHLHDEHFDRMQSHRTPLVTMRQLVKQEENFEDIFSGVDDQTTAFFYHLPQVVKGKKGFEEGKRGKVAISPEIDITLQRHGAILHTELRAIVLRTSRNHFVTVLCEQESDDCYYVDSSAPIDRPNRAAVRARLPGLHKALKERRLLSPEKIRDEVNSLIPVSNKQVAPGLKYLKKRISTQLIESLSEPVMLVYTVREVSPLKKVIGDRGQGRPVADKHGDSRRYVRGEAPRRHKVARDRGREKPVYARGHGDSRRYVRGEAPRRHKMTRDRGKERLLDAGRHHDSRSITIGKESFESRRAPAPERAVRDDYRQPSQSRIEREREEASFLSSIRGPAPVRAEVGDYRRDARQSDPIGGRELESLY